VVFDCLSQGAWDIENYISSLGLKLSDEDPVWTLAFVGIWVLCYSVHGTERMKTIAKSRMRCGAFSPVMVQTLSTKNPPMDILCYSRRHDQRGTAAQCLVQSLLEIGADYLVQDYNARGALYLMLRPNRSLPYRHSIRVHDCCI